MSRGCTGPAGSRRRRGDSLPPAAPLGPSCQGRGPTAQRSLFRFWSEKRAGRSVL